MNKTILVIEDERDIREAMGEGLTLLGYHTLLAANGEEALKILSTIAAPDLIFLDLMMPQMDGWEFKRILSQNPKTASIPIVVLTADGDAKTKAHKLQVLEGLKKPIEFETLLATAKRYLA